jgi:hypothetical protein
MLHFLYLILQAHFRETKFSPGKKNLLSQHTEIQRVKDLISNSAMSIEMNLIFPAHYKTNLHA